MTLKQRLIMEIDSLLPEDLVVVQNIVSAFTRKTRENMQKTKDAYLQARKALSRHIGIGQVFLTFCRWLNLSIGKEKCH